MVLAGRPAAYPLRVLTALGIAVAGALGALARYGLEGLISRHAGGAFPWGTFVVNVSGSFLLGVLFVVLTQRLSLDHWLRAALTVGFLGAYTTFSTLSLQSYRFVSEGAYGLALANTVGSLAAGVAFVYAGVLVGRLL